MDLWFRRYDSFEEEAEGDREFWAAMTPDERVAVVEQLRAEWWVRNGRADPGLERVVRMIHRSKLR